MQDISEEFLSELGRHNYVTPTSYLELISMFHTLLQTSRAENTNLKNRYLVGLDKLENSATQVRACSKAEVPQNGSLQDRVAAMKCKSATSNVVHMYVQNFAAQSLVDSLFFRQIYSYNTFYV